MKKLLTIAAIAAASTALAVESSNTFGILKVTIPAGQQNTIIAAPWCDAGATGDAQKAIKVKDLVKTANLTPATTQDNGDKIFVFNGKDYSSAFQLQTVDGIVKWVGISINGASAGTDETSILRGQAIALCLAAVPTTAKDIYLYGQYTTVSASTTIAQSSAETPAYTLVAPTGTGDDVVLDSAWVTAQTSLTPANGDMVFVPGKGYAPYVAGRGFGAVSEKFENGAFVTNFTAMTVPSGTGFWYITKGNPGSINL